MASISTDKNGNRTIQFTAGDRKRRSIRLGRMPKKAAGEIKSKVEQLNAAAISKTGWEPNLADWVGGLDAFLYEKLAAVGLVPKRAAAKTLTLGAFLGDYVASRPDVKKSTANFYHYTRASLIEFFGADAPLADITPGGADDWRRWLASEETRADGTTRKKLSDNTIRRRCGTARQFFRAAVRKRIITENPFGDMKGIAVRPNRSREYFVTREEAAKVLDACPDSQWRTIVALARFGGLRCPSEVLALRWVDVNLGAERMIVRSSKTEHHGDDHAERVVPIFPVLRPFLEDAQELAPTNAEFVITRYRSSSTNLRTQLKRIIARAGLKPWPKVLQNLRASRATELAGMYSAHVAADWMGHSTVVAQKHYWRTTEEDFEKALKEDCSALQNPVQSEAATARNVLHDVEVEAAIIGMSDEYRAVQCSLMDSNHEPTD